MSKLPFELPKKWILLVVVAVISVSISYTIFVINSSENQRVIRNLQGDTLIDSVKTELRYNFDENYLDVYLTSEYDLSVMEIVFVVKEGVEYNGLSEASLFDDYLDAVSNQTVRVTATGGPEGKVVEEGSDLHFARIQFDGLSSENDVKINYTNSTAATSQNKVLKLSK